LKVIKNKAIELTLRNESANIVLGDIKKSKLLETKDAISRILVYWGLDEMTRLSRILKFNKNLPSPIDIYSV
jgi:hypothetical protein